MTEEEEKTVRRRANRRRGADGGVRGAESDLDREPGAGETVVLLFGARGAESGVAAQGGDAGGGRRVGRVELDGESRRGTAERREG